MYEITQVKKMILPNTLEKKNYIYILQLHKKNVQNTDYIFK